MTTKILRALALAVGFNLWLNLAGKSALAGGIFLGVAITAILWEGDDQ